MKFLIIFLAWSFRNVCGIYLHLIQRNTHRNRPMNSPFIKYLLVSPGDTKKLVHQEQSNNCVAAGAPFDRHNIHK